MAARRQQVGLPRGPLRVYRIRGFHAVNVLRGYPLIEIRSPREVIDDEEV